MWLFARLPPLAERSGPKKGAVYTCPLKIIATDARQRIAQEQIGASRSAGEAEFLN